MASPIRLHYKQTTKSIITGQVHTRTPATANAAYQCPNIHGMHAFLCIINQDGPLWL